MFGSVSPQPLSAGVPKFAGDPEITPQFVDFTTAVSCYLACFFPFLPGGYVSPQGNMFWASLRGGALRVRLVVRVPHHSVSAPRNGRLFFTPWYILLYLLHNW